MAKNPKEASAGIARSSTSETISTEIKKLQQTLMVQLEGISGQLGLWSNPKEQIAELLASHDDKILDAFNEQQKSVTTDVLTEVANQTRAIEAIAMAMTAIATLQSNVFAYGHVLPLIPQGPFTMRLFSDNRNERGEVARFVVQKYFVERGTKQLCFVQASAMAYNLFHEINENSEVPAHCLFHVNGPVAALPLLFGRHNGRHSIVLFWGSIFDSHCAAYLPHSSDEKAESELARLFTRDDEPLKTIFVTPRYITPDGRMFYERLESVHFVNAMAESLVLRDDTEIVVLAAGDRVVSSIDRIPADVRYFVALEDVLKKHSQKLTFVVSHPNHQVPTFVSELRRKIGKLWWQDITRVWQDVPSSENL